ncbi:2OG-Fe dioxygenase family protein [Streptomyces sp. CC228A]|uniref:2OG-Fe dioxygenase family protein n=1 Tax=Streptomyces sp. CC228A TaxID=2898186 RepID=UPI001F2016EB|nr:2OG-Fe dioxygenase family protein [Streptomyces sp. CC228A]
MHRDTDTAIEAARRALVSERVYVMPPADVLAYTRADSRGWDGFAAHWDELRPDPYAAEGGTRRLRRYGRFSLEPGTGELVPRPHDGFLQPERSNALYADTDRHFAPLTGDFTADPVFRAVVRLLDEVAGCLDGPAEWTVHVHPFRVVADGGSDGRPTPEGRHRDGVTLVSSLLVSRRNAAGGESAVFRPDGTELLTATLAEPGTLLLGDDRCVLHEVSAVHPVDGTAPAYRDVLVTTLTPA